MKKLGKLKLNQFSKAELDQRALNTLKGGCSCSCSCACPSNVMSVDAAVNSNVYSGAY